MKEVGIKFCFIEGYKPKGERSAQRIGTRAGKSPDEFQGVIPCAEVRVTQGEASGHLRGRFFS